MLKQCNCLKKNSVQSCLSLSQLQGTLECNYINFPHSWSDESSSTEKCTTVLKKSHLDLLYFGAYCSLCGYLKSEMYDTDRCPMLKTTIVGQCLPDMSPLKSSGIRAGMNQVYFSFSSRRSRLLCFYTDSRTIYYQNTHIAFLARWLPLPLPPTTLFTM